MINILPVLTNDLFSLTNKLKALMKIKNYPDKQVLIQKYIVNMHNISLSAISIIHNFMIGFNRSG